jgi:aryl-alcohol dehydrogenase
MFTTRAAAVEAPGAPFTVHEVTLADLRPDEIIVRMVAAGLCHTDLGVQAGGYPVPAAGGARPRGHHDQAGHSLRRLTPSAERARRALGFHRAERDLGDANRCA